MSRTEVYNKETILFIYPPYFRLIGERRIWYPLGLGYLASYLKSHGVKVFVYNADSEFILPEKVISYRDKFYESKRVVISTLDDKHFIWRELRNVLNSINPKLIGISVLTDTLPVVNKIISVCKEFNDDTPIVLGGPHLMLDFKSLVKMGKWDYALLGEAERSLLRLVKCIFSDKQVTRNIKGLICKRGGNLGGDFTPLIRRNLDELPFPDLDDMLNFGVDLKGKIRKTMISTSRGCPFRCSFCFMSTKKDPMRFRSASSVIKEIKINMEKYAIKKFYFNDDCFGVNRRFLEEFSGYVNKEGLEIKWSCMTHEKLINKERLELMKKAGCSSIHLGIESGSDRILKILRKKTTVKEIIKKCKLIDDFDIKLQAFFMVGMPGEQEEDIRKSINLLEKLDPYEAILQIYVPYPNTELWNYIRENYCDPLQFYDWLHFYKAKVNYKMFPKIPPQKFDLLLEEFFSVVEDINKRNNVY